MWVDDEDREYEHWWGALRGGFEMLNEEERLALLFGVFLVAVFAFSAGYLYGGGLGDDSASADTMKTVNGTIELVISEKMELPDATEYCNDLGYGSHGRYGSGKIGSSDTLSITCHPEEDGTWTSYYFDLNMTLVDSEETVRR